MVLNRQRHTDERHRGNAGRNTAGGLAGLDENAELTAATLPASVHQNIALNAFEISILNTWSIHNMLDGVRDVFNDAAGILSGGSISGGVLVSGLRLNGEMNSTNISRLVNVDNVSLYDTGKGSPVYIDYVFNGVGVSSYTVLS